MSDNILEVRELRKEYRERGGRLVRALDGVSFTVGRGEIVGLLGANGAGKTTTLKCVCTLVRPTSGQILVNGVDAVQHPSRALPAVAAVLEGNRNIYWQLTPRENLEFFAGMQGLSRREVRPHIEHLLEFFRLSAKGDTPARMLSRGMQQKLALACALVKGTELLLLDEPTLGLDVHTSFELRASLRGMAARGERTVLVSSHDMQVMQAVCDRIVIIHAGRVVADEALTRLLDLFRPRGYRVEVEGAVSEGQEARLRGQFGALGITRGETTSTLELESEPGTFYTLIDALRASGLEVHSMERRSRSLEEIYLSLTGGS